MKSFVVFFALCIAICYSEDTGCTLLNGKLQMKTNDVFEFGEACLRFRCIKGDEFKVSMGCEVRWRGAPNDVYEKELTQLAEDVKKGQVCRKAYLIEGAR